MTLRPDIGTVKVIQTLSKAKGILKVNVVSEVDGKVDSEVDSEVDGEVGVVSVGMNLRYLSYLPVGQNYLTVQHSIIQTADVFFSSKFYHSEGSFPSTYMLQIIQLSVGSR